MAIDYEALKRWEFAPQTIAYTRDDSILYALSLGYGADPLDESELPFVQELGQKAVPSIFTVLGAPGTWASDPRSGIAWRRILHGEHRMALHGAAQPEGNLRSELKVSGVIDKGAGKGALVITERRISDEASGVLLATIEHTSFCRSDGGFGRSDPAPPALPQAPDGAPDAVDMQPTLARAALLYRLNGDKNPVHADPAAARAAGFDKPILHGLCTYGMAAKAVLRHCCDNDTARMKSLSLRFSAPFFPGETLRVEIWRLGCEVRFRASAAERGVVVLSNGLAMVDAA